MLYKKVSIEKYNILGSLNYYFTILKTVLFTFSY